MLPPNGPGRTGPGSAGPEEARVYKPKDANVSQRMVLSQSTPPIYFAVCNYCIIQYCADNAVRVTYTIRVLSASVSIAIKSRPTAAKLGHQVREFVAQIDLLADRLTPLRRPQDVDEPECSRTELRLLSVLARKGPLTMTELASSLSIHLSSATRAIDKLVSKGLVKRNRVAMDRRVVQVGFSRRGKEINGFVVRQRAVAAQRMLAALKPRERELLIRVLSRLAGASETSARQR
jgi:DNA-binding MarR family transcriptional regulator